VKCGEGCVGEGGAAGLGLGLCGGGWRGVDEAIFLKFNLRYGPDKLKSKYLRLRSVHTKFTELINRTGVT